MEKSVFDVIIVGGSYTGLSAALGLARLLMKVLIIDNDERCNKPTHNSHNLLTHDGTSPAEIARLGKEQVLKYKTVECLHGKVVKAAKVDNQFEVITEAQEKFRAKKLLFATGTKDKPLPIPGYIECWGNSIHQCPFCHGYEVRDQPIGVIFNGKEAPYIHMLYKLSQQLKIFTNGPSVISSELTEQFKKKNIPIYQSEIEKFEQEKGQITHVILRDGSKHAVSTVFVKPPGQQHLSVPEELGCIINKMGYIQVDDFQRTNVPGVFAGGDNTTMYRALSVAIAAGTKAAASMVMELTGENFNQDANV